MLSHVLHRRRQIGDNPGLLVQGTIVTPWIVWVDVVNPIFQMTFSDSADYIYHYQRTWTYIRTLPRINPGMHIYSMKDFSVNGQPFCHQKRYMKEKYGETVQVVNAPYLGRPYSRFPRILSKSPTQCRKQDAGYWTA